MDGGPRRPAPDTVPRQPARDRRSVADEREDLRAAERDLEELGGSVQRLGPSGRGPLIAAVLIVLAFAVGLVRPWDWLSGSADGVSPSSSATAAAVIGSPQDATARPQPTPTPVPEIDAAAAAVCDYPQSWRTATIQDWAGRRARVWTAVDAVEAQGPLDPAIAFTIVGGSRFTAIGWCAPVDDPTRPPDDAVATLYRISAGKAVELPVTLLEPDAPNPLAELLAPAGATAPSASGSASDAPSSSSSASGSPGPSASSASASPFAPVEPTWAPGRYVIELASPDGSWARWIGVELRAVP